MFGFAGPQEGGTQNPTSTAPGDSGDASTNTGKGQPQGGHLSSTQHSQHSMYAPAPGEQDMMGAAPHNMSGEYMRPPFNAGMQGHGQQFMRKPHQGGYHPGMHPMRGGAPPGMQQMPMNQHGEMMPPDDPSFLPFAMGGQPGYNPNQQAGGGADSLSLDAFASMNLEGRGQQQHAH